MADNSKLEIFKLISKRYTFREVAILKCGLDEAQVNDNQIFNNESFNTYKLKQMSKVKDTVNYDITLNLNKVDGQWKLESPDRITLEKIHGLYDYTSNN